MIVNKIYKNEYGDYVMIQEHNYGHLLNFICPHFNVRSIKMVDDYYELNGNVIRAKGKLKVKGVEIANYFYFRPNS
jgi:hypothetical protein